MKLRELVNLIGFRPRPQRYGYRLRHFELPDDGRVDYAQWMHPREAEQEITGEAVAALREFLTKGDFCIDIGAHSGDTAIPMGLAVGKNGCVLALEPNDYIFPVLEKNSTLNRDRTNIVPLMVAATPEDGEVEFEYSDSGFCNGGRHEGISKWKHGHAFKLKVQGINLSHRLRRDFANRLDRLRFIKVDTEGYDLPVLRSIADVIDECQPFVMAEMYKLTSPEYRAGLYEFFASRGYTIFKMDSDFELQGQRIGPEDLMNWKHYDIYCEPSSEPTSGTRNG